MTRLSCHRFRPNKVRLWPSVIAHSLRNLWRWLVLPRRVIGDKPSYNLGRRKTKKEIPVYALVHFSGSLVSGAATAGGEPFPTPRCGASRMRMAFPGNLRRRSGSTVRTWRKSRGNFAVG